jgi:hypothetical protein
MHEPAASFANFMACDFLFLFFSQNIRMACAMVVMRCGMASRRLNFFLIKNKVCKALTNGRTSFEALS